MSDSLTPEQNHTLYYQCFEKLLPIAGRHIEAVNLDWWDLDRFLGLAFYTLLAETDSHRRRHIAQLLPAFGAKAVPPLIVLLRQQNLDAASIELANHSLRDLNASALITGLINVLKSSEDASFDELVAQKLAEMGRKAVSSVEDLLSDPEWRTLALRILPQIKKFQTLGHLYQSFQSAPTRPIPIVDLTSGQPDTLISLNAAGNGLELNVDAGTIAQRSQALMQKAAAKAEAYAYIQAIETYTEVLGLCPDNARAYGDRGLLRSNIGDQQGAIADIQSAALLFRQQGKTANFEIAIGYLRKIMYPLPG
jgi:tetratricopeptide (TPR) repeat protein